LSCIGENKRFPHSNARVPIGIDFAFSPAEGNDALTTSSCGLMSLMSFVIEARTPNIV
jgi:hypothetical protein